LRFIYRLKQHNGHPLLWNRSYPSFGIRNKEERLKSIYRGLKFLKREISKLPISYLELISFGFHKLAPVSATEMVTKKIIR